MQGFPVSWFNPGTYFFPGDDGINEVASLDNQAFSLFAQADWHISDRLTATLGFNYTDDEKDATLISLTSMRFLSTWI